MKTQNRITLILFFIIFFLVKSHLSLSAQKTFLFNDLNPLLAELISDIQYGIILSPEATSSSPDLYYETELRLEPWMFGSPAWIQTNNNLMDDTPEELIFENDLQLEDWMLQLFGSFFLLPEKEEELRLEEWMMNPDEWLRE